MNKFINKILTLNFFSPSTSPKGGDPQRVVTAYESQESQQKEAWRQEKMRWGIVGFNGSARIYLSPNRSDAPSVIERVEHLRDLNFRFSEERDLAAGLKLALSCALGCSGNRRNIIFVISDRHSSTRESLLEVRDEAVRYGVGIHGIAASNEVLDYVKLLSTKAALGYGSIVTARNTTDLTMAIENAARATLPRPATPDHNRCIFALDFTEQMSAPFSREQRSILDTTSVAIARILQRQNTEATLTRRNVAERTNLSLVPTLN